jgi:hypothetical protein
MRDSLCVSTCENAVSKIDQIENGKINENAYENVNAKKSIDIEIDLKTKIEKIESSTQSESIASEQVFITKAEPLGTIDPIDDAVPVNTGDSDDEISSLDQNVINLCQTIACNDTVLNVGYDSGATVTLVSEKVAKMSIAIKETRYILDTVGGGEGLKSSTAVRIPLAMKNGGMHVLDALVTSEKLGKVMALPPQYDVEKVLAVPRSELADRGGGDIDILVGRDNTHFSPRIWIRGGRFLDFLDFQPVATGSRCKMLF